MVYFLRKIKLAYQRVTRGYDDTIYWGFDGYFSQFIPAIELFCKNYLSDKEHCKLNPYRTKIYKKMLALIEDWKKHDYDDQFEHPNSESRLWEYFGKNIGAFWD